MKIIALLILMSLFSSCKDSMAESERREKTDKNAANVNRSEMKITNQNVSNKAKGNSVGSEIHTDTVQFEEFLNGGDYNIFMVKKNREMMQLYGRDADSISDFKRGENVIVQWKLDTVWEPEQNSFDFYPCLVEIKRP